MRTDEPWRWAVRGRTLAVTFSEPHRVLSWAPLGGGLRRATIIANHRVDKDDRAAADAAPRYLAQVLRRMNHDPARAVAMMTAADVERVGHVCAGGVAAWCTAGCSNALTIGDPTTLEHVRPGTINLVVALSQPLATSGLAEAMQLAVEARVAALREAGVRSTVSGEIATGTGTDCVAIAAPIARPTLRYCGKHTRVGEMIGRVVLDSCRIALAGRTDD